MDFLQDNSNCRKISHLTLEIFQKLTIISLISSCVCSAHKEYEISLIKCLHKPLLYD